MSINKKYYLWIGLIILIGFFFKVLVAHSQPLCLDEKYSIFYANQFSYLSLIKNFAEDVHPGSYYLFLKILLELTHSKTLLRILSSVLIQIVALFFLVLFFLKKNKKKEALVLSFIFTFNPFFNHLSFQLRSYSLVFLFTILTYLFISLWQESGKKLFLFAIFSLLVLANSIHYVMYIFSFFVLIFISLKFKTKNVKRILFIVSGTLFMVAQFIFLNGFSSYFQYKEQFQDASWIALPSFLSIPRVYLTSLGMDFDVMNTLQNNNFLLSSIFYTICLVILVFFIKQKSKIDLKFFSKKIIILAIIPLLVIPLLSYFITFLSHRFFFNQFIPRISLFIPRILLPFIIILWISLIDLLSIYWKKFEYKIKLFVIFAFLFVFVIYWIWLNFKLNVRNFCSDSQQEFILQVFEKNKASNIAFNFWPHWMLIEAIQPQNLDNISSISEQKTKDKRFEQLFISQTSHNFNCEKLQDANVYAYVGDFASQEKLQKEIINILNKCCVKQKKFELFENWQCGIEI